MGRRALLWVFGLVLVVLVASSGSVAHASTTTKPYVVVLKSSVSNPGAVAAAQGQKFGFAARFMYSHALKGYAASLPSMAVSAIQSDPRVAFVSPDTTFRAASTQVLPTGVERIGGDQSDTISGDGEGSVNVNVAVLDSGIDPTQPDLNVVGGTNCSNGHSYADEFGHGTEVAGVIGAIDNSEGVVGVAPDARLWAVRVLNNNGSGSASSIICGIDWVTSTRTDADSTNDIVVANMSFAGKGTDDGNCGMTKHDPVHEAICRSVAEGVSYVTIAGNAASDFQRTTPAAYNEVLTTTAMKDTDGQRAGQAARLARAERRRTTLRQPLATSRPWRRIKHIHSRHPANVSSLPHSEAAIRP